MNQARFVFICKNSPGRFNAVQNPHGITTVKLKPGVIVTHNYNREYDCKISFNPGNEVYNILSERQLVELTMVASDKSCKVETLRKHCQNNLMAE